jgi:hypothetical protein
MWKYFCRHLHSSLISMSNPASGPGIDQLPKKSLKNYKYKIVVILFGQQLQGTISCLHYKYFTIVNDNGK